MSRFCVVLSENTSKYHPFRKLKTNNFSSVLSLEKLLPFKKGILSSKNSPFLTFIAFVVYRNNVS